MAEGRKFFNRSAFAVRLGVHPRTLARWEAQGLLRPVRIGGCIRYTESMLEQADRHRQAKDLAARVRGG